MNCRRFPNGVGSIQKIISFSLHRASGCTTVQNIRVVSDTIKNRSQSSLAHEWFAGQVRQWSSRASRALLCHCASIGFTLCAKETCAYRYICIWTWNYIDMYIGMLVAVLFSSLIRMLLNVECWQTLIREKYMKLLRPWICMICMSAESKGLLQCYLWTLSCEWDTMTNHLATCTYQIRNCSNQQDRNQQILFIHQSVCN